MSTTQFMRVVRERWKSVTAVLLACLLVGALYAVTTPKRYEATAQLFVSTGGADAGTATDLAQGNVFVQARVQSYTSVANSPAVTNPVAASTNGGISASALAKEISADAPLDKVLVNVHVVDGNEARAVTLANAVAARFRAVVESLEQSRISSSSPVKLTIIHPAELPAAVVSTGWPTDLALAVLVGLAFGIALALLRDRMDDAVPATAKHSGARTPPARLKLTRNDQRGDEPREQTR